MNDYEPIRIQPLRLRGVYGIAWMLYRRNFSGMFLFTLLLCGLPMLLLGALPVGLIAWQSGGAGMNSGFFYDGYSIDSYSIHGPALFAEGFQMFSYVMIGMLVIMLLSLAYALVIQPILAGSMYTEMSARLYGQASGFRDLMRRGKFMLRRFFTTHLSILVAEWGISLVVGIVGGIFMSIAMVAVTLALFSGPNIGAGAIVSIVVSMLLLMALAIAGEMFIALSYPAAVNEQSKNFKAVERSFKIVSKRFGRMLGVSLTISLAALLLVGIFTALLLLLGAESPVFVLVGTLILGTFFACLFMPYAAAVYTVLYFDGRVRLEGTGWQGYSSSAPADDTASSDGSGGDGSV